MKKHLIAAAVAAAVAVPAMAQVTISGNAEVSHVVVDNSDGTTTLANTGGSFVGTPGIKFSGTEDLGGGLKAGFTLQMDVETPNGNTTETSTNEFSNSFIELSGGFGTVRAGKFDTFGRDAGGVYRFMGDIGRVEGDGNPGTYTTQNLGFMSPTFGGVQVSASTSRGAGRTTTAIEGAKVSGAMVTYSQGPLKAAYSTITSQGAITAATSTRTDVTVGMFAAGYDFGIAKVGAFLVDQNDNVASTNVDVSGKGINVAVPAGKFTVQVGIQKYELDTDATKKTDMMSAGVRYDFSKRTSLYGTWQQSKGAAAGVATGYTKTRGLNVEAAAGKSNAGYGISLVHNF